MDEIGREQARRSLRSFSRQAWPIVEPNREFQDNWHIGAVCEHLEAVTAGEINRLLILVPPGSMKSLTVAVFWPAWVWGPLGEPWKRWMFSSYVQHLSTRDSIRCRRVIRSPWYQRRWGDQFRMVDDRDTLTFFQNNHMGHRLATSTDGVSTGERGDVVVADDPHSVREAESETKRQGVLTWWSEAMSTRVNDPKTSAFVVIMQRLHSDDLAGYLISEGNYVELMLPMEFEPDRSCRTCVRPRAERKIESKRNRLREVNHDSYSWDPRRVEDELLWPSRYDREDVTQLKKDLRSYGTAAQLQMRPSPRGGGLVQLNWFGRYRTPPGKARVLQVVQSWDTADKGGQQNAYSVCETWAVTPTASYLLHVLRRRMNIPTLQRTAISHVRRWKPTVVLIEDAASGTSLIQHLREKTSLSVFGVRPDRDKLLRMDIETPAIEAGNVILPEEADWLPEFEEEVETFPRSRWKDQVDAMSQFLHWVRSREEEVDWKLY